MSQIMDNQTTDHHQRPWNRHRTKSSISGISKKSKKSQHSEREEPTSSSRHSHKPSGEIKPHLHKETKADPNAAMSEAQPIAAALEAPTMAPIRTLTHKDDKGNPIVDPDFSNPTRSRWERPLETIRRFQEQIDEDYKRRVTVAGQEMASRRSSYYGDARGHPGNAGMNNRQSMPPRHASHDGYYGSRQMPPGQSYAENGWSQGQGYAPRSRHSRPQYENGYGRQGPAHNVYPTPGYQQSRDTVNTHGSGGSYSEPYHSDPNSESSSFERRGSAKQPDLAEQYGFQGFGENLEMGGFGPGRTFSTQDGSYQQQQQQLPPPPPPPPPHAPNQMAQQQWGNTEQRPNQRPVISLNSTPAENASADKGRPNVLTRVSTEKEKRGSWFKRRFSKN